MKCFEVTINGKQLCTAGIGDDGVLTAILALVTRQKDSEAPQDESKDRQSLDVRVGGLINLEPGTSQHVDWLHQNVSVGDEITIRIIESAECDEPLTRETSYLKCAFCEKKQLEAAKLIAGPNTYICNECVVVCSKAIAEGEPTGNITLVLGKQAQERCSFCGKKVDEVERIVGVPGAHICNECIKICGEILEKDADN